jgi:hypothetical protein
MDPNSGVLIMNDSMKMKSETRKSMLKAARFRHRLKKYARSLKNRQRKESVRVRIVGKLEVS